MAPEWFVSLSRLYYFLYNTTAISFVTIPGEQSEDILKCLAASLRNVLRACACHELNAMRNIITRLVIRYISEFFPFQVFN
jgi:hypothetical protein